MGDILRMFDEKLNKIIKEYRIYEKSGVHDELILVNEWKAKFYQVLGLIILSVILNRKMSAIEDKNIAFCSPRGKLRKIIWYLLLPWNREKIRYLISVGEDSFENREVVENWEIGQRNIRTILVADWDHGGYANLIGQNYEGKIIDVLSLIYEKHLEIFFSNIIQQNPYVDIFISKKFREKAKTNEEKEKWDKRIIAYYLQARDFLSLERELQNYVNNGFEDYEQYVSFWRDVKALLSEIKEKLAQRQAQDVLIHWLDQMEKEEFFSMKWVGNTSHGTVFHNAYSVMTNTTAIARSIFTGRNVKEGNLKSIGIINEANSRFLSTYQSKLNIKFFTRYNLHKYIKKKFVHDYKKNLSAYMPSMISFWEAIDAMLMSTKPCVFILHSLETHDPYCSGETDVWHLCHGARGVFPHVRDYSFTATISRNYIDKQLEWYHVFYPLNSITIYMSDHGHEMDLSNQNINMPFKIVGKEIFMRDEYRLFSYKELFTLIESYYSQNKQEDNCFSECVIADSIEPYNKSYLPEILSSNWNHFWLQRGKVEKEALKKYLQTTKIVTAEGEYYTVNILGEESYYRDSECKKNLANDPAYASRTAELRKMAGKFKNPWKEKQKVAIDFYQYLGIKETDIMNQCD